MITIFSNFFIYIISLLLIKFLTNSFATLEANKIAISWLLHTKRMGYRLHDLWVQSPFMSCLLLLSLSPSQRKITNNILIHHLLLHLASSTFHKMRMFLIIACIILFNSIKKTIYYVCAIFGA